MLDHKKILAAVALALLSQTAISQSVKWTADVGGGVDFAVLPFTNTIDGKGNVYVAGLSWGELFGSDGHCFLTKYTSQGALAYGMQWGSIDGQVFSPSGSCEPVGVVVDNSDRLWLGYDGVQGQGVLAILNQNNRSTPQDLISLNGRSFRVIQRDKLGYIYVWSIQTIGRIQTSFITKFDGTTGSTVWENSFQFNDRQDASYKWEYGSKIAFDHFRGILYAAGDNNTEGIGDLGYLAALNMNDGQVIWRKAMGGAGLSSVHIDESSNAGTIWITGYAYNPNNPPGWTSGMWATVAKLDTAGNTLWSDQYGTTDAWIDTTASDVKIGTNGVVNVIGFTSGDLFGPSLFSTRQQDGYVRFYDTNGVPLDAFKFGTDQNDQPTFLSLDKSGDLLITGFYVPGEYPTSSSGSSPINLYNEPSKATLMNGSVSFLATSTAVSSGPQFFTSKISRYVVKKSRSIKK